MRKYLIILSVFCMNLVSFANAKNNNQIFEIKVETLSGCRFNTNTQFNFGVIDYTEETKAVVFPIKYAPHAELPMDVSIQCTPGVMYQLGYEIIERDVPTNANGTKVIKGIILNNENGSSDFLLAYIYNTHVDYLTMLHDKNIIGIGTGEKEVFNLIMGLQNPLERGYMYPAAGVYSGESIMTLTF